MAGRYAPVAAVALLALCPNIVLTTAVPLLQQPLATALHGDLFTVQVGEGLSNAGYALGAVLAAFLVQRFRQRTLFLATESAFVAASVLAAVAWAPAPYVIGRAVEGVATGLMLVIALPPLVTRFGVDGLPRTAALVNVGLFGAVTAGPVLGGIAATSPEGWRWLLVGVATVATVGAVIAALSLRHEPPFDPDVPPDWSAFALAGAATFLPFVGVSQLVDRPAASPMVWAPVTVGLCMLVLLVVRQYRRPDALMPVRALSTALPVVGTVAAMVGGACVVTLVSVTVTSLLDVQHASPLVDGGLLAPEIAGVAIAAAAFARLLRTRWLPLFVLSGMVVVAVAGVLLLRPTDHGLVLAGAAVLGVGAGATVSPGLFLAAFGVSSRKIGRAFALVELLRAESAYLVAPVLLYVARSQPPLADGLKIATWAVLALCLTGVAVVVGLYRLGRVRMHAPDLAAWLDDGEHALHSPSLTERKQAWKPEELAAR